VLPKIISPNSRPAITAAPGAHHYRFIGVEVTVAPEVAVTYNLIELGNRPASPAQLPHHLIFDRVYVHGTPHVNLRRGIALNSAWTAIIDSAIADVHEVGADSQAIAGWDGPGPYKIVNNYLEGAGENVMFGGADPSIRDLVPSDIEIRHNHFFKPLAWRIGDPGYAGRPWTVKNLLELKNARRVLIDGNLFEHNWAHAQAGTAIVFTVRNQDGTAPWSAVEDVTFTNNVVRHTGAGVGMHGIDGKPSRPTKRLLIKNNLLDDVSGARWKAVRVNWSPAFSSTELEPSRVRPPHRDRQGSSTFDNAATDPRFERDAASAGGTPTALIIKYSFLRRASAVAVGVALVLRCTPARVAHEERCRRRGDREQRHRRSSPALPVRPARRRPGREAARGNQPLAKREDARGGAQAAGTDATVVVGAGADGMLLASDFSVMLDRANEIAVLRGGDVDQPRNLAKSVTVE
jgi:hypothetical protein